MSKPKIYDAYLRIISERDNVYPVRVEMHKLDLKHVCKINKKLNKLFDGQPVPTKYVPCKIYTNCDFYRMAVSAVTDEFIRTTDPAHIGSYQSSSEHLKRLIEMSKSLEAAQEVRIL